MIRLLFLFDLEYSEVFIQELFLYTHYLKPLYDLLHLKKKYVLTGTSELYPKLGICAKICQYI